MEGGCHVGGVRLERGADRPAELTMLLDALPDKAGAGREHEVPRHPLPHEVEVVAVVPHVLARAADHVVLARGVVAGGSGRPHLADVGLGVEAAHGSLGRRSPRPTGVWAAATVAQGASGARKDRVMTATMRSDAGSRQRRGTRTPTSPTKA